MPRVFFFVAAVVLFSSFVASEAAASETRTLTRSFDYLHLEANAGGASGGHAAICFDTVCYDFQQADHGTIRLRRQSARQLDHFYRVLDNRTIHATNVDVSESTHERLRSTFESRYRIQNGQFDVLTSLGGERAAFEHLLARKNGADVGTLPSSLRIPGSGYFVAEDLPEQPRHGPHDGDLRPDTAGTRSLANRIRQAYGPDSLVQRSCELREEIRALAQAMSAETTAPTATRLPTPRSTFADRYADLLGGLLAVEVLSGRIPSRASSFLICVERSCHLSPAEIRVLESYAADLEHSLAQLFASKRPDWGYPLLVGLARLTALGASIESGRMVLLDVFREDATTLPAETLRRHRSAFSQLLADREGDFLAARNAFFGADSPTELDLNSMEIAANRLAELRQALGRNTGMRVHDGIPVPARGTLRASWPRPRQPAKRWQEARDDARRREQAYARELQRLYPYDLIRRNCVTEIFHTLESSFEPRALGTSADTEMHRRIRELSTRLLGGHVETRNTLNFIPFLSARAVSANYRSHLPSQRPSRRAEALGHMLADEPDLLVYLRESNVLTARSYEPNAADSTFLFFGGQPRLGRPLFGTINLAVGIGATAVGLATLPFDDGAGLRAATQGVLFSLPELLFLNLRKGSYPFSSERWLDHADATATPAALHSTSACGPEAEVARSYTPLATNMLCEAR